MSGIQGTVDGIEQTAPARASLNANNEKLMDAYQRLAHFDALIAAAKVVEVQNNLFLSAMKEALTVTQQIAATWGQSPIEPPGSGISLKFATFSQQVAAISSQQDAESLTEHLQLVATPWNVLNEQFGSLKRIITSRAEVVT